jgi:hypothetical protein
VVSEAGKVVAAALDVPPEAGAVTLAAGEVEAKLAL